jgi:hypothetical protein
MMVASFGEVMLVTSFCDVMESRDVICISRGDVARGEREGDRAGDGEEESESKKRPEARGSEIRAFGTKFKSN